MPLLLKSDIIGTTLRALLIGVHFASFLLCLRWLIFSDDGETLRKPIQRHFLIITTILFASSVTHFGFDLQVAFIFSHDASIPSIVNTFHVIYTVCNPRTEWMMGWTLQKAIDMLTPIITDSVLVCDEQGWSLPGTHYIASDPPLLDGLQQIMANHCPSPPLIAIQHIKSSHSDVCKHLCTPKRAWTHQSLRKRCNNGVLLCCYHYHKHLCNM